MMKHLTAGAALVTVLLLPARGDEGRELSSAADVAKLLEETAQQVSGGPGEWTALYRGARVVVYAIEQHGRMRIMAPVASAQDLDREELQVLLEANYGRALDAKFAISDGVVWSLFNRPLPGLDRTVFLDGLEQVVTLKKNFGTSYRSTDLTFGRPPQEEG